MERLSPIVSASAVASSQVLGSQYGRLEKPRVPRKKAVEGGHTHRTIIERGPEARWWKWGSHGGPEGLTGVIWRLTWGEIYIHRINSLSVVKFVVDWRGCFFFCSKEAGIRPG